MIKSNKKKNGQKKSKRPFISLANLSPDALGLTLSKGRFLEAVRGEAFGDHPGLAEVRLRLFVYNPIARREVLLSNKRLDLLIGTIGEVDELLEVIRRAIKEWISGGYRVI